MRINAILLHDRYPIGSLFNISAMICPWVF